jgi:hypothetical protein
VVLLNHVVRVSAGPDTHLLIGSRRYPLTPEQHDAKPRRERSCRRVASLRSRWRRSKARK